MRHRNHRQSLGVRPEHREALMAQLATALFTHGEIRTTLTKAKALRPFAEKMITYAKKAHGADKARSLHLRRLAIAKVRDRTAVNKLFNELVTQFTARPGGYTRIYKLGARRGDAAEVGLIKLIFATDEGYRNKASTTTVPATAEVVAAPAEATNS
ncbi:MAG: 50S ribosomal protein L17 [Verrucomicrobiota bacterium]|nr:50S ribosomal protein L17 [Verrucomicrobiota bacterium]